MTEDASVQDGRGADRIGLTELRLEHLRSPGPVTAEKVLTVLIYLFGIGLTTLTVHYAYTLSFTEPTQYSNVFLGVGLALYYLIQARKSLGTDPFADTRLESVVPDASWFRGISTRVGPVVALVFAALSLCATAYVHYHFVRLEQAYTVGYTTTDILVGFLIIFIVTDATRRAFGYLFTSVVVFALVYAYVGPLLPGILNHSGMSPNRIAREGAIGLQGTYGFILDIGATWVAIFIMFAGIAKAYGALDYILDVGREASKTLRTGVVQMAVVASMIMGSITGSAAANTATTGSFTIPMIKEQGIRDDFAGAIEAVASSGGQMLPPVMGVAAFLMADILGVPYVEIIQAGVIPAALFYLSVGMAVYLLVLKFGWTTDELEAFDYTSLLGGLHFAIPLTVLIYTLVVLRFTPLAAGFYTIVTIIAVMFFRNVLVDVFGVGETARAEVTEADSKGGALLTLLLLVPKAVADVLGGVDRSTPRAIGYSAFETVLQTLEGFKQGAVEMAPLVGILGSLGVILQLIEGTGLSGAISQEMVSLAGGVLVLLLIMAMLTSILFGLGMPTPAAYILVAMLIVPSVIAMDIPEITAHMFVFYFAMLSAITPPVAVSVAIGSSIAGASFAKSCVQALRIGAPGFVIPFAFVTNNSLIYWSFPDTLIAFPVVLAGTTGLVVMTVGFDGAHDLSIPWRLGYGALAALAMFGSLVHVGVQIVAAGAIVAGLVYAIVIVGYDLDREAKPAEASAD
ncbi:TRAP transporter fused permease subunit [Salinadaptatus halalkaliphilus]|uniref:TRAP transporter fused permease subunit n=1 Tax=Salinadaptatus halalkaliphilus TaxID=2419781 RepID=A0A4S3TSY4_9EURY|nr:TRAP transporter fused permease subunit [Salinadaptatus halalkaliphilus]THE66850.1 TRAP transporter fused permease subunit [Salinadaptatus halalkaliphilus]